MKAFDLFNILAIVIAFFLLLVLVFFILQMLRSRQQSFPGFEEWMILGSVHRFPELFEMFALAEMSKAGVNSSELPVRLETVGQIELASGYLVVGDPFYFHANDFEPFDETLPAGKHTIEALIVRDRNQVPSIAALRILFPKSSEVDFKNVALDSWELRPAFPADSRFRCLEQRYLPAFGVQSGYAGLISKEDLLAYKGRCQADSQAPVELAEAVSAGGPLHEKVALSGLQSPIIMAKAGAGVGSYRSYFISLKGEHLGFLVDFAVIGQPEPVELAS
ncbi:MAG: DUF4241 domain-containing protein [Candidatus Obscuribacterales bacterium]|nr:DUF4241 domain-containing protein [Candidatus Obscuribacterales bacterium]